MSVKNRRYREGNKASSVVVPEMKRCARCKVVRPSKFFSLSRERHDHLDHRCRFCKRTLNKINGTGRNNVAKYLNGIYGITEDDYGALLAAQEGKCAICARLFDQTRSGTKGHVDHSHATGKVRGLLCNRCNGKLGAIEDSDFHAKALAYLGDTQ